MNKIEIVMYQSWHCAKAKYQRKLYNIKNKYNKI